MPQRESLNPRALLVVVGFSARSAAFCAHRAGYSPVAIDFCEDRDLIPLSSKHFRFDAPESVAGLAREVGPVPVLLTGGMEHRLPMIQELLDAGMILGCDPTQIRHMRSPALWSRWALSSGLDWPTTWFPSGDFACGEASQDEEKWIIKSQLGVGGLSIQDWEPAIHGEVCKYLEDKPNAYVQKQVHGDSIGVSFLSSQHGTTILGAAKSIGQDTQQFMPPYTYRGSTGPIALTDCQIQKLQTFAEIVGKETGFLGLWQADFICQPSDKLSLLEINPRWSASMEILDVCSNLNLVYHHVGSVTGTLSSEDWRKIVAKGALFAAVTSKPVLGKLIIYAARNFQVTPEQSEMWWRKRWLGELDFDLSDVAYADIPRPGAEIARGEPILTCIACSTSQPLIEQALVRQGLLFEELGK